MDIFGAECFDDDFCVFDNGTGVSGFGRNTRVVGRVSERKSDSFGAEFRGLCDSGDLGDRGDLGDFRITRGEDGMISAPALVGDRGASPTNFP